MMTTEERRQASCDATKRWRAKNPDAAKNLKAIYYQRHKVRLRAQLAPANLARSQALRRAAIAALGGACTRCGFDDERALQIDHVEGGGTKERARIKSRDTFNKKVIADQTGYQCLCANCNWIKRIENEEHLLFRVSTSTITED